MKSALITAFSLFIFSLSLTILFFSMRAVLGVGGYCAEGGPYEIAVHCPEGIACLTPLSIFGLLGGIFLFIFKGGQNGITATIFFWAALFTALGWNFLEFGFSPPDDSKIVLSWVVCGVLFIAMGLGPVYLVKDQVKAYIRSKPKFSTETLIIYGIQLIGLCIGIAAGVILFKLFT